MSFRDRTLRLWILGGLALLGGIGFFGLALAQVLVPLLATDASPVARPDLESVVSGLVIFGGAGGVLVVLGVGSLRTRRWVPPLMLIVGWVWLLAGIPSSLFLWTVMGAIVDLTGGLDEQARAIYETIRGVFVATAVVFGVVVPATLIVGYRHPDVAATCRAHDPRPSLVGDFPRSALALPLGWGALALLSVPLAMRPALPVFGWIASGAVGAVLTLGLGGLSMLLARWTWQRRHRGWIGTGATFIVLGLSSAVTFLVQDPADFYRALDYPENVVTLLERSGVLGRGVVVGATVLVTVASLVFLLRVRPSFRTSSENPSPSDGP